MNSFTTSVFKTPQYLLIWLVKAYRLFLSPWLGGACRFELTCSAYALQALAQHGALGGSYLTLYRLARCQPWCDGGHDPVPQNILFTRLVTPVNKRYTSSEKKSS